MIPVWLLDVDGVINVTPQLGRGSQWPRNQWTKRRVRSNGTQWTVTIADAVLDFLRRADASGRVEIRWHTTWQHDALKLSQASGCPSFRFSSRPSSRRATRRRSRTLAAGGSTRPRCGSWEGEQATDLDRR